jgi:hypothetical protein
MRVRCKMEAAQRLGEAREASVSFGPDAMDADYK